MSLTGCMQNLILNNMQQKVQLDYERGGWSTRLGSRSAFGFGGSHRPQPSVRAKPRSPCPIATRAFTENVFLGRRAAIDKNGA